MSEWGLSCRSVTVYRHQVQIHKGSSEMGDGVVTWTGPSEHLPCPEGDSGNGPFPSPDGPHESGPAMSQFYNIIVFIIMIWDSCCEHQWFYISSKDQKKSRLSDNAQQCNVVYLF